MKKSGECEKMGHKSYAEKQMEMWKSFASQAAKLFEGTRG